MGVVVALINVGLVTLTAVAGTPPNDTLAPLTNPVPVIVVRVPPAAGPVAGSTPATVGGPRR
jgi:hypothetical protein